MRGYDDIRFTSSVTQRPLFVYGTLQDADILAAVLGRSVDMAGLKPALAPGHKVVVFPDRVYPALVQASDKHAAGLLVFCLDSADFAALDAFEGDEYRRETVDVLADGETIIAEVYRPALPIPATQPDWTLGEWTMKYRAAVLDGEIETANNLRQRLTAAS